MEGVLYTIMEWLGMTNDFGYMILFIIELVVVGAIAAFIAEKRGKDSNKAWKRAIIIVMAIEIFWWIIS